MKENRYIRQITLLEIGETGQQKLAKASVLVVGAGGLGNACLPYLASSGIGKIGIIDGDVVSKSNLHRQILFSEKDIDQSKAEIAKEKLSEQFPEVDIESYAEYLHGKNALQLFQKYDVIIDATDNIEIRYLINDACVLTQKAFVHASIYRFQFQIAVFNFQNSGTYRCLYPNAPKEVQSCAEAGVMPTTVALAGLYQTNEVFKIILGIGELIADKLLLVNTLTNSQHQFKYKRKEHSFIKHSFFKEQYDLPEIISFKNISKIKTIILDVRNFDELPRINSEDILQIPLNDLGVHLNLLNREHSIYIFCQSGKRSQLAAKILTQNNFKHVYCLQENALELLNEDI